MTDEKLAKALADSLAESDSTAYVEDRGEITVVDGQFNLADVAKRFLAKVQVLSS